MKKIIPFLVLIFLTHAAFASMKIEAIIKKGSVYTLSGAGVLQHYKQNTTGNIYFPEDYYDLGYIQLESLKWIDEQDRDKRLPTLFSSSAYIDTVSIMRLTSYEQKTGYYKFKLSLKATGISGAGGTGLPGGFIPINANFMFNGTMQNYMYVEGTAKKIDDKLTFTNTEDSSFAIISNMPNPYKGKAKEYAYGVDPKLTSPNAPDVLPNPSNTLFLVALKDIPVTVNIADIPPTSEWQSLSNKVSLPPS